MYRSPNGNKTIKMNQRNNPFSLGNNNLRVRFKKALSILLSREYYEGSLYGKIYNKIRPDGRSQIYVDQPVLEKKVQKKFIEVEDDIVKFLVGPTGVGKTTLIRNMFHVFNRDVTITDNNFIIYVSFYSMVSYFDKAKETDTIIQDALLGAINEAVSYLDGRDYVDRLVSYDDAYYDDFYSFMCENNKHLIQTFPDNSYNAERVRQDGHKYILDWIAENKPMDYHMCQLKYYLNLYKKRTNKMFNNIILILDDLESLDSKYAKSIIDCAYHCKKCLQANFDRGYYFKALISLRNYSYRIQQIRRKEAFREIPWDDVIMKDIVPELSSVLEKRTSYVLNLDEMLNSVDDREAFKSASESLQTILLKMYGQYDKMLLSLTHNNIFKSMTLLFRILTNKSYLGKYEIDRANQNGAFDISSKDYHLENHSSNSGIPGNDDVYYALVYGEQGIYFDSEDYYLTNIMHYKSKEGVSTELLGLYIIQYFIQKGVNLNDPSYDGFESLKCSKVIDTIMSLYSFSSDTKFKTIYEGFESMMEYMYRGGVFLQSIIEPIKEDIDSEYREYTPEMKVFLSLRGSQLYNMLSYNALLFTTYRDDIDTDIEKNDVLTLDMSMNERMLYCLSYIDFLADKEIELFRAVSDYENYKNVMGSELAVTILMKGMEETIKVYYVNDTQSRQEIVQQYHLIQRKVNGFLDSIYNESQVMFTHVDPIYGG